MNSEEQKEVTPEQKKEIAKILFNGRVGLFAIGIKFGIGLFAANIIAMLVGIYFLKDTDPEVQVNFQLFSFFLNFIFMITFLNGQLKKNSDIVTSKVKEVLKKE